MFAKRSWTVVTTCALLLALASCAQKKQDLVHKAFEDKDFGRQLPKQDQRQPEPPEKEEEDEKTKSSVIVDNIKPVQEETVYMETGKAERPRANPFEKDPLAPAFNFDEVQIYEIIRTLADLMELNYIIDPAVQDQAVTIRIAESDNRFRTSELFDLILKLHDLTMIVHDNYVHIVPISSPEVNPGLDLLFGSKPNENLRKEELAIQLIPLKYVAPSEMSTIAKEFLSPSARIYEEPKNNILIIIDKAQYVAKVLEMAPIFDVDALHNKKMVFYQLAHVDAVEIVAKLQEIMTTYGYDAEGERLNMMAIETLNGVLVVSTSGAIFKELDFWIAKFDQEAQFEEDQVFVYQIQNTTAYNIAYTLSQIYGLQTPLGGQAGGPNNISQRRTTNPNLNPRGGVNNTNNRNNRGQNNTNTNFRNQQNPQTQTNRPQRPTPSRNNRASARDGAQDPDAPTMIVDEDNNSLIFLTTSREYNRILKTLKKLDILPRQVFLEVTVLSVELTDLFQFGINWTGSNAGDPNAKNSTFSSSFSGEGSDPSILSSSYTYVGLTSRIQASLTAAKQKGYANVLQQPHIMAIDNKPATISVGTDVPITTTTTNLTDVVDGGANNPASSSTVQYRNTGVTLGFTPHINANGVIRLEIGLDISQAGAQAGTEAVPISQNALETEMIVRDGQTIIMGGLIFNQENWGKETVPFLGRIPLLKHLFTKRNSTVRKNELVVMITPRLVDSEEKSIAISKEFKEKILEEFETFKDSRN